jgi:para-nitrobenzyl esterase
MPSAKGLFHKAVMLSGASTISGDKEYSEKLGAYVLKEAVSTGSKIEKLQQLPWNKACPEMAMRYIMRLQSKRKHLN